ncbi:MAG: BlaI/MecI/CopY family transcriptional regulator [Planctomycetota bacterium]|jgi:predicted transcriptional regulator
MARKDLKLTEGEWEIIQTVWENEPCAAPTVQEKLKSRKQWSYSTVKTMMDRMAGKGLLETEKVRNLILYSSAVTKSQAQSSEVMRIIRRAFDGALTPMMQFMLEENHLSEEQLGELERMIKNRRRKIRKSNKSL